LEDQRHVGGDGGIGALRIADLLQPLEVGAQAFQAVDDGQGRLQISPRVQARHEDIEIRNLEQVEALRVGPREPIQIGRHGGGVRPAAPVDVGRKSVGLAHEFLEDAHHRAVGAVITQHQQAALMGELAEFLFHHGIELFQLLFRVLQTLEEIVSVQLDDLGARGGGVDGGHVGLGRADHGVIAKEAGEGFVDEVVEVRGEDEVEVIGTDEIRQIDVAPIRERLLDHGLDIPLAGPRIGIQHFE
jgi:hypothetical protein